VALPQKEGARAEPQFLPDGHHYLYLSASGKADDSAINAGSIVVRRTSRHELLDDSPQSP
jgi:hypothetical protein